MIRLILVIMLGVLAWRVFDHHQSRRAYADAMVMASRANAVPVEPVAPGESIAPVTRTAPLPPVAASTFRCDDRTMCSQMHSCEEATFFLQNCPGTKMDDNHDGIPCERQWCH